MARGASKKEAPKDYKEFDITAEHQNNFTGRIYSGKQYDKGCKYGLSITINGIDIKGVSLWVPDDKEKNASFMWPSYKNKDGDYVSYIGIFNKDDAADAISAANKLADLVNE